jgi:hypothetical protein
MPFHADSGLVFDEVVLKKPRLSRDDSMRCTGMPPARKSAGCGSESLVSISLRKLLSNLDQLDSDSLSGVPEKFLLMIWKAVKKS